jgi:hypothetical protein
MPSPKGSNQAGLFLPSAGGYALDAAPAGGRMRKRTFDAMYDYLEEEHGREVADGLWDAMIAPAYEAEQAADGTYTESEHGIGPEQELAQHHAAEAHKKLESFIMQNLSADKHEAFWQLLTTCEQRAGREAIAEHKAEASEGKGRKRAKDQFPNYGLPDNAAGGRAMDSSPDAIAAMARRTIKIGPVY